MLRALLLATLLLAPTTASADRFTFGVGLGRSDLKSENDTARSRSVFARVRLAGRVSLQLEAERSDDVGGSMDVRRVGVLGRVDLGTPGRKLTPYGVLGVAVERLDFGWGEREYRATELGGGLDYQIGTQLVLGGELRVGEREAAGLGAWCELDCFEPNLADRFVSARVTLGLRL